LARGFFHDHIAGKSLTTHLAGDILRLIGTTGLLTGDPSKLRVIRSLGEKNPAGGSLTHTSLGRVPPPDRKDLWAIRPVPQDPRLMAILCQKVLKNLVESDI